MKDVYGTELKVGDYVVFVQGKNDSARIATGYITKFYGGQLGRDECSVDTGSGVQSHVRSFRIMKLDEPK
ncbi:MAG: hypothetical protein MJ246_05715 [Clostridia bacterium]|nr:hypothetical protein [Clostridia bacterium]